MAATRIGVVGAGIVGLAVARRLAQLAPDAQITVLDKERAPAAHQTSHNSGVAHAGLYYAPGSLKATLCRRGIGMLKELCQERGIAYQECGKLVVARDASELGRLDEIERRARANGVPGLRRVAGDRLTEVEPHVRGAAGLHSPSTAIVDFRAVACALADELTASGTAIRLGFEVVAIERRGGETRLTGGARDETSGARRETGGARDETSGGRDELAFDRVVLCAGLQSDRLAWMAGGAREPVIIPFRGEYQRLTPGRTGLVRGLIYPVPDPSYPFLGVHFTPRIDGTVDIGPNAVLALAREGYRRRDLSLADVRDTLRSPGFRRLARRHWRMGARELYGSLSRRAFVARACAYVPELRAADVTPAPAGVRAQAIDPDGSLVDDFRIEERDGVVMVRNAPSPAATSSLAIAEHIADRVLQRSS